MTHSLQIVGTRLLGSASLGALLAFGPNYVWAQSAPTLYVTNQNDDTVSAISTSANTVTSTISGGLAGPWGAAASGDDSFVYTVNLNGGNTPGYISVIDTATNTLTGAHIQVGLGPIAIALTPNGSTAYVTNENSNTVSVINAATNTVIATIPVGTNPFLVAISPDGNTVYVSNSSYTSPSMQFAGANITSNLPMTLMSQGGVFDTAGNNAALSGAIAGLGGLTKIGLGTLTLSGAGTYSGPTAVNAGTLQAGAVNVFSPFSAYTVAGGASLDLNGFSQVIGGLAGTGSVRHVRAYRPIGSDGSSLGTQCAASGGGAP